MNESKIACPNCGHSFDVEAVLATRAEERIRKEMESTYAARQKDVESLRENLLQQQAAFEEKKKQENELFRKKLEEKMAAEKKQLAVKTRAELDEEYQLQLKQFREEIQKRKDENLQLKHKELDLLKKEEQLKEDTANLKLEAERIFMQKKNEAIAEALQKEKARQEMMQKEYEKKLEDQSKLLKEAQRKAEQGSMQLQGEVQELAIEDWLMQQFPLDKVEEIKKGQRGGDCYQVVNSRSETQCGIIYYESKRTKHWKQEWIVKLKTDMTSVGADIGVIVTEAMPDDMDRMGLRDGVWICTFQEFKGLSQVLRQTILKVHSERSSQENKGDKMVMLYDFLTSNEFRLQVESIVEAFDALKSDLEKEKRAMLKIWKSREKHIDRVMINTVNFYGSIKGIAGNAISPIQALELPDSEEE